MDILADFRVSVSNGDEALKEKTFLFLIKLMGYANQLRFNHWQTTSYAEHKMTDGLMSDITGYVDSIGEATLGAMGRPQINTTTLNISDMSLVGTKAVLDTLCSDVKEMLAEYKVTEYEGHVSLLGELDAIVQKYKYLQTLS